MKKKDEIYSNFFNKGYRIISTLKEHDSEFGKGNYLAIREGKKYLLKAFSGFKKKHLKSEHSTRIKLSKLEFPGVDTGEFFESPNFNYLVIPYIENKGNLKGREENYTEDIMEALLKFHSLPKSVFEKNKRYRMIHENMFSEEKYPYSHKFLKEDKIKKIQKLFLKEIEHLHNHERKPSHNDFNGDNLLLSNNGKVFITDFEKCSLNFELEDFSRIYFFNVLENGSLFEENRIYNEILSKNKRANSFDLDVFFLYQALRFNEYVGVHKNKIEKIPEGKEYDNTLKEILNRTFERNLK